MTGFDPNGYAGERLVDLCAGGPVVVVRTDRRNTPSMGETVFIKPQANQVHLFNAVSGARIA